VYRPAPPAAAAGRCDNTSPGDPERGSSSGDPERGSSDSAACMEDAR
jgi:hypothetical protein